MQERSIKEKFLDALELPKEVLSDVSRVTIIGNSGMLIENYGGIIEYDENLIRFSNNICIIGNELSIEEINALDLFITGRFSKIEF